jgi:hypothetical protein
MGPMLVTVVGAMIFLWVLWLREHTAPFFEIGAIYVTVVVLYTVYPLAGFLVNGLAYTPFNDNRLFSAQPTPQEIGTIGWYYVAHLLCFIGAYLLVRGRLVGRTLRYQSPGRISFHILIAFYLLVTGFVSYVNWRFGLWESSYIETYLILQIASLLQGARFVLEVAILSVLFGEYRKYRAVIFIWFGWMLFSSFLRMGTRTELILFMIAMAILYHYLVHRIPLRLMVTGGLTLLALFVSFGLLRNAWLFSGATGSFNPFAYGSEFEAIFANAYDFRYGLSGASIQLPPGFYLADLLIMIPHQLLPFEKINPAEWYVTTFYPLYADLGGGLAFGTICESLVGGGWLDAGARGAALGIILALIHRRCILHRPSFWLFVFYVWLSTQMYQSFRNTTFFPLYLFVYRFLWVVLGIKILSTIPKGSISGQQRGLAQPAEIKV